MAFASIKNHSVNGLIVFLFSILSFEAFAQVVRFSHVQEQSLQSQKRVVGTLRAKNQANIAASEAGKVTFAFVNEGDFVKKGDKLFLLDDRKRKAEQKRLASEKSLAEAKFDLSVAEFEQAEQDYLAYKQSATKNAISEQRLRQSKTLAVTAQANVIAAKQAVLSIDALIEANNVRLADMTIKAPFDGQVTLRHAEIGQWLAVGETAVTLTSSNVLEAWLDVPERFAHLSQQELLSIPLQVNEELVTSLNVKILKQVDSRARTFKIVSQLNSTSLMPGMSVDAWLPETQKQPTLTVPKDALVQRGGNNLVYKVVEQGDQQIAQPVNVVVKFHQDAVVAIAAQALKSGDKVITEGNERLMPGPVMAVPDTLENSVMAESSKLN